MEEVLTAKVLTIRESGHDEHWLRDMIYEDPAILGLGDLQAVMKEKSQSQGGRLDLLLKNPEDDSMFEVELQLGASDESHVVRTIEYWERELRRWPSRSHTAVLVAEKITSRFFNVVHLLSKAVPIVGIQASIVQVGESKGLLFTKIIDFFEEPEEEEATQPQYDERYWAANQPGALACGSFYRNLLQKFYGEVTPTYHEDWMSLKFAGIARVWISRRKNERALIELRIREDQLQEVTDRLNQEGISFRSKGGEYVKFNVNAQELQDKAALHEWLASRLSPNDLRQDERLASIARIKT